MAGRAEMRFVGDKKLVCDLLPAVFALDPAIRQEIFVGRDVPEGGLILDSDSQKYMVSRSHAKLLYSTSEERWKLFDLQSTNGILHNGIRVSEALLSERDTLTFGGAKSTQISQRPGPKALKSIYTYSFHLLLEPKHDSDGSCESPLLSAQSRVTSHVSTNAYGSGQVGANPQSDGDGAPSTPAGAKAVAGRDHESDVSDTCPSPILSRKSVSGSNRDGGSSKAKAQGSEETRRGQAGSSGAVNAGKGKEPADEDELVVPAGGKEEERKDLARRGLVGGVGKESEKSSGRNAGAKRKCADVGGSGTCAKGGSSGCLKASSGCGKGGGGGRREGPARGDRAMRERERDRLLLAEVDRLTGGEAGGEERGAGNEDEEGKVRSEASRRGVVSSGEENDWRVEGGTTWRLEVGRVGGVSVESKKQRVEGTGAAGRGGARGGSGSARKAKTLQVMEELRREEEEQERKVQGLTELEEKVEREVKEKEAELTKRLKAEFEASLKVQLSIELAQVEAQKKALEKQRQDIEHKGLHSSKALEHFDCCICQNVMAVAHNLRCGHAFCGMCILKWLRSLQEEGKTATCPECRREIPLSEKPNRVLPCDKFIESMRATLLTPEQVVDLDERIKEWNDLQQRQAASAAAEQAAARGRGARGGARGRGRGGRPGAGARGGGGGRSLFQSTQERFISLADFLSGVAGGMTLGAPQSGGAARGGEREDSVIAHIIDSDSDEDRGSSEEHHSLSSPASSYDSASGASMGSVSPSSESSRSEGSAMLQAPSWRRGARARNRRVAPVRQMGRPATLYMRGGAGKGGPASRR